MMQIDLFTDTLIQLMREVFAPQAISSEQRTRIYARITSNQRVGAVEHTDFWTIPAVPFDEPSVDDTADGDEADQLWLFPDFETQADVVESTLFSLPF